MFRKSLLTGLSATIILLAPPAGIGHAQPSRPLDEITVATVIDTCLAAFKQHYVYPDVVEDIERYVKDNIESDQYSGITSLLELTKRLRADFRRVANDRHVWIDIVENIPVKDSDLSEQAIIDEKRKKNFGFVKYEIMQGNIGYLRIDNFNNLEYAKQTAIHAVGMLANSDAVILDLRNNHGGYANMVHFVSSYFFEEKIQLNSLYFREADSLAHAWTDPDVPGEKLVRQKLYVLTSENTASAAESFAYSMKHYNRATIVGEKTRGAAHWNECYKFPTLGIFLEIPVARPINPVTRKSWEGTGVVPDVETPADDALDKAYQLALENKVTD